MLNNIISTLSNDFSSNVVASFPDAIVFIIRMALASICGFVIGIERGRRQKDAGIRTHLTVALGAALLMIISKYGFVDIVLKYSEFKIQADVSRIASCVVTGVSFLGAGVIFVRDISIKGLTTAAGIWTVAGIGMAMGAGLYVVGVSATVFLVICQVILHNVLSALENTVSEFKVVLKDVPGVVEEFRQGLDEKKISVQEFKMHRDHENNTIDLDVVIKRQKSMSMRNVLAAASDDKNVISIDF